MLGYRCFDYRVNQTKTANTDWLFRVGYMSGNDDMIINWWNLVNYDRNKIWEGSAKVEYKIPDGFKEDHWI